MPAPPSPNDPVLRSWVDSANDPATYFPIQNLPLGVYRRADSDEPARVGVAIGEQVLDLAAAARAGMLRGMGVPADAEALVSRARLNDLAARGQGVLRAVRARVSELLRHGSPRLPQLMVAQREAEMLVPFEIGDYSDFYASIHHATNVGSMFRPDAPLLPNYKHMPIGYHGRASSIVASGTPVRRPMGQTRPKDDEPPIFGPSRMLDYELELGCFIAPGNALGERIGIDEAPGHVAGLCLVNDWSARDVQKWEYQPLGPFNAKNFGTTVSPWVVTLDALEPFRIAPTPRPPGDPAPLPYLTPREGSAAAKFALDITLEVLLQSEKMRAAGLAPVRVSRGSSRDLYWTFAQMIAHHTSTGCNLRAGDLLASGTVSGPTEDSRGCLLERTWRGEKPLKLPTGEERKFLADGDLVVMRARCERAGAPPIGFGECAGLVAPPL